VSLGGEVQVLLVSSSGGVLLDLLALEPWWSRHNAVWAVESAPDTRSALAQATTVHWLAPPGRRLVPLAGSLRRALQIVRAEQPDVVVSAGSSLAVPFFAAARITRTPTVWVWTLNLVRTPGISGRMCAAMASEILLQRESMRSVRPRGVFVGELY
jgi:hypothetical protein